MLENRINTKNRQLSLILPIAVFIVVLIAFVPFVLAARYTVFSGDDFWIISETLSESGSSYLVKSLQKAWHLFIYWQGDYFCNVLQPLLNPLRAYSYTQLRLTLIAILFLSFVSCLYMSFEIAEFLKIRNKAVYIFAVIMLPILLYREYPASYLWYVGTVAYQISTILFSVSIGLTLHAIRTDRKPVFIAACIFTFCTVGGSFMLGTFASCILLVSLAGNYAESGRLNRRLLLVFAVSVIGNLIHALAPGNFARHEYIGDYYIFRSVYVSFVLFVKDFLYFAGKPSFLFFVFCAFLIGFSFGRRFKWITVVGIFFGLIVSIAVSVFPVILGYNMTSVSLNTLSNNHIYVLDIVTIASCEIFAAVLGSQLSAGGFVKNRVKFGKCAAALVICLFIPVLAGIKSYIPTQIYENLSSGKIQEYSLIWRYNYELMENGVGEDVVIVDIPEPMPGAMKIAFGSSPETEKNIYLTRYFGMNSVCDGFYYYNTHNDTP